MRKVLIEELLNYRNQDFLFMVGDVGYRVIEPLKENFPDKYLNTGVNEQFMASFAAGVAKSKPCFIYSIANFSTLRCLEQIRNDICLHDVPVCIVSVGGGFGYGALGPSHHNLEDIACLGSLPNLTVLSPSSRCEVKKSVEHFFLNKKPTYLRLSSLSEKCEVNDKKNLNVYANYFNKTKNNNILVLSSGFLVSTILSIIQKEKLNDVIDLCSICNLSKKSIEMLNIGKYQKIISFDEAVYAGSISSHLNKYLIDNQIQTQIESFFVGDYSKIPGGDAEYYRDFFGLSHTKIYNVLKETISKK